MILVGGSEEDLWVFTGVTSNAKAKSSKVWTKIGQILVVFGGCGSDGTKAFDLYSKRHLRVRIRVV